MKVVVANYQHKHGNDIRVFASFEAAAEWKRDIASDNWEDAMETEKPADRAEAANQYWERCEDCGWEFFETSEQEVSG